MVRRLEPMPSILAPSLAKKLARSTTWGSQAALSIVVVMGWTAAKMRAFSVAVTEASSRKISTDLVGLGIEVGTDGPFADDVAAGKAQGNPAEFGQKRAQEND